VSPPPAAPTESRDNNSRDSARENGSNTTGFFYTKGQTIAPNPTAIPDPWSSTAHTEPPLSESFVPINQPPINQLPVEPPPVEPTPIVSTYVYPDDNYRPQHAWESTAKLDLSQPPPAHPPGESTYYSGQSSSYSTHPSHFPQPSPESDLSPEEMQSGAYSSPNNSFNSNGAQNGKLTPMAPPSALAPRLPGQVYGQSYVNQILGKMGNR
jgi:hypothetical protein